MSRSTFFWIAYAILTALLMGGACPGCRRFGDG